MNHQAAEHPGRKPQDRYIYLADQPDLIPKIAAWFFAEWGSGQPGLTVGDFEGVLKERLNKDRLPLTLVLLWKSALIATASLVIREMETHMQYPHWLASVYVLSEYRRRGIGSRMVEFSATTARQLGVKDLYLYTRSHERFYARLGWQPFERTTYRGRPAMIMKRIL